MNNCRSVIARKCNIIITFKSVAESLECEDSNESYRPVVSHSTVYFSNDRKRKPSETFPNFSLRIFESERVEALNMSILLVA